MLNLHTFAEKRDCYRRAHPSFTLYRGLSEARLQDELGITCFGFVNYTDSSSMGLYGYNVQAGSTSLLEIVHGTPVYSISTGLL
jgi:hypothetical protein